MKLFDLYAARDRFADGLAIRSIKSFKGFETKKVPFSQLRCSAGFNMFVPNPVEPDELISAVATLLKKRPAEVFDGDSVRALASKDFKSDDLCGRKTFWGLFLYTRRLGGAAL